MKFIAWVSWSTASLDVAAIFFTALLLFIAWAFHLSQDNLILALTWEGIILGGSLAIAIVASALSAVLGW